MYIILS